MSIENSEARKVEPTHPGEMFLEDFMPDYGLTAASLAEALRVSRQTVNELLRGRRAVSQAMALRLSRLFGNTPEFWLNTSRAVDNRLLLPIRQLSRLIHPHTIRSTWKGRRMSLTAGSA